MKLAENLSNIIVTVENGAMMVAFMPFEKDSIYMVVKNVFPEGRRYNFKQKT